MTPRSLFDQPSSACSPAPRPQARSLRPRQPRKPKHSSVAGSSYSNGASVVKVSATEPWFGLNFCAAVAATNAEKALDQVANSGGAEPKRLGKRRWCCRSPRPSDDGAGHVVVGTIRRC